MDTLVAQTELREEKVEPLEVVAAAQGVAGKGFGIRAGAYVIDAVIMRAVSWAVGSAGGLFVAILLILMELFGGCQYSIDEQNLKVLDLITGLVFFVLYFTVFEWLFGASPAKLILGMRVVQQDGGPCTLGAALVRGLVRFIDGLFFGLPAYSSMKSTPLRQRLGDKSAKTIVVGYQDEIIQQPRTWWWFLLAALLYFSLATATTALILIATLKC